MPYKINNEYLANLIFLVRIVSYGSSYLTSSIFGPCSSRLGHKSEGILSVRTVKTSLVRGIYHFFLKSWKLHEIGDLYGKHSWKYIGRPVFGPSKERKFNLGFFTKKVFIQWFPFSVALERCLVFLLSILRPKEIIFFVMNETKTLKTVNLRKCSRCLRSYRPKECQRSSPIM